MTTHLIINAKILGIFQDELGLLSLIHLQPLEGPNSVIAYIAGEASKQHGFAVGTCMSAAIEIVMPPMGRLLKYRFLSSPAEASAPPFAHGEGPGQTFFVNATSDRTFIARFPSYRHPFAPQTDSSRII